MSFPMCATGSVELVHAPDNEQWAQVQAEGADRSLPLQHGQFFRISLTCMKATPLRHDYTVHVSAFAVPEQHVERL